MRIAAMRRARSVDISARAWRRPDTMSISSRAAPILPPLKATALPYRACTAICMCRKPNVTDDPSRVGPVDIVLFAVKLWDTRKPPELARPLVGPNTRVITLQNGIDSVERVAPILGADQTVGGATYIATVIASPGVIKHTSSFAKMRFGRADKRADDKLIAVRRGPARPPSSTSIFPPTSNASAGEIHLPHRHGRLDRRAASPIGPIAADPETARLLPPVDGGRPSPSAAAKGVALDPAYIEDRMDFIKTKVEPGMKASMAHDLERGNRHRTRLARRAKCATSAAPSTFRRRPATRSTPC